MRPELLPTGQTDPKRGRALGLDARSFLNENDSYSFFEKLGDLLITGPTGTNVMDLRIMLISLRKGERDPGVRKCPAGVDSSDQ